MYLLHLLDPTVLLAKSNFDSEQNRIAVEMVLLHLVGTVYPGEGNGYRFFLLLGKCMNLKGALAGLTGV